MLEVKRRVPLTGKEMFRLVVAMGLAGCAA